MGLAGNPLVEKAVLIGHHEKFDELKMLTLVMELHKIKVSLVRVSTRTNPCVIF